MRLVGIERALQPVFAQDLAAILEDGGNPLGVFHVHIGADFFRRKNLQKTGPVDEPTGIRIIRRELPHRRRQPLGNGHESGAKLLGEPNLLLEIGLAIVGGFSMRCRHATGRSRVHAEQQSEQHESQAQQTTREPSSVADLMADISHDLSPPSLETFRIMAESRVLALFVIYNHLQSYASK